MLTTVTAMGAADALPEVARPDAETQMRALEKHFWLDAWFDPLVGLHAFSSGMCLDADRLYVGDLSGLLKVFHNGKVTHSIKLNAVPTAVCSLYEESGTSGRQTPLLAVACGPSVKIFKDLRPYHKFTVPAPKVSELELDVWQRLKARALAPGQACALLREHGNVSRRSADLLALEGDPRRLASFVADELQGDNFAQPQLPLVTCMDVLRTLSEQEPDAAGSLVLGTESGKVLLLDSASRTVAKSFSLPSAPVFLAVSGARDVEYRVMAACRDQRIYSIKNGDLVRGSIALESPVCGGLVRCGRNVVFACMDGTLHSYHVKGRKSWTVYLPAPATNVSAFACDRVSSTGVLVALRNGETRLYIDKTHICSVFSPGRVVTGARFGDFNREPNTLVLLHTSGALAVKMLKRTAKLDPAKAPVPGPPREQDVPLAIPKKTKLYVELTQRERDNAVDMHRAFQHSLCKLRLVTARSYLRLFQHAGAANAQLHFAKQGQKQGNSPSDGQGARRALSMSAAVRGIGPQFRLTVEVRNLAELALVGATATAVFSGEAFHVDDAHVQLPALVPHVPHAIDFAVHSLVPGAQAPAIVVCITRDEQTLLTATVDMPVSEAAPL